jgi:DNA-binding NarL/FixJ family response regulator
MHENGARMSYPKDRLSSLEQGRAAFEHKAWGEAFESLSAADEVSALGPEDLERWAMSAYLIARDADSVAIFTRAYQEALERGEVTRAVRSTFWLFFQLINKGDEAQAGGWFARGRKLLDESELDCVEQGYLMVPIALRNLFGHDFPAARAIFTDALAIGERFGDADLTALSTLGLGQSLVGEGDLGGLALFDEVMVGVTSDETTAVVGGIVYCAVIGGCHEVFDLRRAQEWTDALTRWCAAQPDLVPFRGNCLVHRTQLMALRGSWSDALEEARRAVDQFVRANDQYSGGWAYYELAEVHRRRGEFQEAEEAYRQANQMGHPPQPGLAQLRLAQGQTSAADGAIRRALDEATALVDRCKLLPATVEILLAAGDVAEARKAADELLQIAAGFDSPLLEALASHADGAVLLSDKRPKEALAALRRAGARWQELDAPYEGARTRYLSGLACRRLGDEDGAALEIDAARWSFERLGAEADLVQLDVAAGRSAARAEGGLTGREVEVLALVAAGKSNRQIATELVISEKTVARHVSNIFVKLGVSSRAAATAYAFTHDLV